MSAVRTYAPVAPTTKTPSSHDCGVGVSTFAENHAAHRTDAMNCSQAICVIYSREAAHG